MHYVYIRPMSERTSVWYENYTNEERPLWLEHRLSEGFYEINLDIADNICVAIQW